MKVKRDESGDQRTSSMAYGFSKRASGTAIDTADLALDAGKATAQAVTFAEAKRRVIEDFERSYLRAALGRHGGNVSRTAEAIGMVRQSLQQKMRELGLAHGRGGSADDPDGK